MACDIAWERAGVVKTFAGFVTGPQFIVSAETVAADPRFDDLQFIINDFRAIDGHSIDSDAYLAVAASRLGSVRTNANFRVLFIADGPLASELATAVEPSVMSAPFDPMFFPTLEAGREWLAGQPRLSDFRPSEY